MLKSILTTEFAVSYKDTLATITALSKSGVDVVDYVDHGEGSKIPYVGFSIYSVNAEKVALILASAKIPVVAVDGDINSEFDIVERAKVESYGEAETPNYGSLYYRVDGGAQIEFEPMPINDGDIIAARWTSLI
jgi:hypothetical protein